MAASTAPAPPNHGSIATDFLVGAFILLKIVLVPLDFIYQSIRINIFGCLGLYLLRCGNHAFKYLNRRLCKCVDLRYIDHEFPASAESVNSKNPHGKYYAWMRAYELSKSKENGEGATRKLFCEGVSAGDLSQGGLGE